MLRQILFLTSNCLTAYHYDGRKLDRVGCFVGADAGLAHFDSYLQRVNDVPALILTDLVEEDFRTDSVAHTHGRDRKALLERHVSRLYRGTNYRHSKVLGRDPQNRRKDEVLFSGLLNPEFADMWLQAMAHHKVPVVGIYSLPLLSTSLIKQIWTKRSDVLLVTHNAASGLRQSFFSNGQLRFSRLTPVVTDLDSTNYAQFVHAEIGKTKRYLSNLHLLQRDVILEVCMISGGLYLVELERMRSQETLTHYSLLNIVDVAKRVGHRGRLPEFQCDELFAFALARQRETNHYANDEHRYHYKLFQARQVLHAGAVMAVIAGVLWSGTQIVDGLLYQNEARETEQLLAIAENRYLEIQQRAPITELAAEDVDLAVTTAGRLQEQRRSPHPVLTELGQALLRQPGLEVERIDWFVSSDKQAVAATISEEDDEPVQVNYDENGNPIEELTQNDSAPLYQIGVLHGRVAPFEGNYARAHQRIDDLLASLRGKQGVVAVEALELPLNTASSGRVTGGIGGDNKDPTALFVVRLVLGGDHAQL